jgi:hypothetical protein
MRAPLQTTDHESSDHSTANQFRRTKSQGIINCVRSYRYLYVNKLVQPQALTFSSSNEEYSDHAGPSTSTSKKRRAEVRRTRKLRSSQEMISSSDDDRRKYFIFIIFHTINLS